MVITDGYIVFVVQAINEGLNDQYVHAGLSKLLGGIWILNDCQNEPSYAVSSQI
jgi:hypothetical protein